MYLCGLQHTQNVPLVHAHIQLRGGQVIQFEMDGLCYLALFDDKTKFCLLLMLTKSYGNVYTMPFYHQVTRKKNNQALINLHPLLIPKTISIGLKYCQVYSDDGIGL